MTRLTPPPSARQIDKTLAAIAIFFIHRRPSYSAPIVTCRVVFPRQLRVVTGSAALSRHRSHKPPEPIDLIPIELHHGKPGLLQEIPALPPPVSLKVGAVEHSQENVDQSASRVVVAPICYGDPAIRGEHAIHLLQGAQGATKVVKGIRRNNDIECLVGKR